MHNNIQLIYKGSIDMKKWISKFLEKLAASNKETFGNKKLNCCNLSKKK